MRRAAVVLAIELVLATVLWWPTTISPFGRGAIVLLDVYTSALTGTNWAAAVTPAPRVIEEQLDIGERARVTWFIPALGERHPAMLIVNGATALGNDDPETRRICEAVARAGYLAMLPQLSFMTDARFDPRAPEIVDAAFAAMLARPDVDASRSGAFGFSVGGGILLAAAGRERAALSRARYLGVLGAYFDVRTYLASVVSATQRLHGRLEPWAPDAQALELLPRAALDAATEADARARVVSALAAGDYDSVLARLDALPASVGATFSAVSPATAWSRIAVPVFWLHDERDRFEPIAEAEAAMAVPHAGRSVLQRTRLLSHAAALGEDARAQSADFWIRELGSLMGFAMDILRTAE